MARPQRCKNGEVKAGKGGVGVVVEEEVERDSLGCVLKTGVFKQKGKAGFVLMACPQRCKNGEAKTVC